MYSLNERIDILFMYFENDRNLTKAAQAFALKYPDKPRLPKSTVSRLIKRFKETGSVKDRLYKKRRCPVNTEENATFCLASVLLSPKISTRKLAQHCNISQTSVIRILKKENFHPYKLHILQELHAEDLDRRLEFCEWVDRQSDDIGERIIFSDEAIFHLSGHVNRHNSRYWSQTNPHWIEEHSQVDPRVMVWCGIHNKRIIGPYFFDNTVNSESYLEVLENILSPYLDEIPISSLTKTYFQQDGAPAHFALCVRNWLNRNLPDMWIGRRGPIEWPPRSPDITPLDFFLWGYLKSRVYTNRPQNLQDLKERITLEISLIEENTLANVCRAWKNRIDDCKRQNGSHVEQFY